MNGLEYIEEGHIYLYKGVVLPSATEIISLLFQDKYKDIPEFILEKARVKGTAIHKAIEDNYKGNFNLEYQEEVDLFFEMLKEKGIEIIDMEKPIVCYYKNEPICCGRLDLFVKKDNLYGILDIKTTSKLDTDYVGYQLNIYKNGMENTYKQDIDFLGVVWLKNNKVEYKEINVDSEKIEKLFELYKEKLEEENEQDNFEW